MEGKGQGNENLGEQEVRAGRIRKDTMINEGTTYIF